MSRPSSKYLEKVERWMLGGLTIDRMNMTLEQKFRARMAYEAYQVWQQDKQIRPADVMRRLAAREYSILLETSENAIDDNKREVAKSYVEALRIKPGTPRTITEISNDVAVFNWIVGRFDTPVDNIERAKVVDASDWLVREGMKRGDARSVKSGADLKMRLHNDFKEEENVSEQMPTTDINITGDVSVIKSDQVNYTDEEKRRLAKRFGLTSKEFTDLVESEDGTWQLADEGSKEEPEKDFYEELDPNAVE